MGEAADREALYRELYPRLKEIAARLFRRERPGHTFTASDIIHEALLKLLKMDGREFASDGHFLGVAVRAMRQVILDHIRRSKRRAPLHEDWRRVRLDELSRGRSPVTIGFEDLDAALVELARSDERAADVAGLRLLTELTKEEIASSLGISRSTFDRTWARSKGWLKDHLGLRDGAGPPRRGPPP